MFETESVFLMAQCGRGGNHAYAKKYIYVFTVILI